MSTITTNKDLQLNPSSKDYYQYPYPFGVDPVWQVMYLICMKCISLSFKDQSLSGPGLNVSSFAIEQFFDNFI
jgi:hypothetical protein